MIIVTVIEYLMAIPKDIAFHIFYDTICQMHAVAILDAKTCLRSLFFSFAGHGAHYHVRYGQKFLCTCYKAVTKISIFQVNQITDGNK